MTKHSKTFDEVKEQLTQQESQLLSEINAATGKYQSILKQALIITGSVLLVSGIGYAIFKLMEGEDKKSKPSKKDRKKTDSTAGIGDKIAEKVTLKAVELATGFLTKYLDSRFFKRS